MTKLNRICLLIFFGLIGLVIATNAIKYFNISSYEYILAKEVSTFDDISSYGVFVRTEQLLEIENNQFIDIAVGDGERVARNQDIAYIYSDENYLNDKVKVDKLYSELELLNSVSVNNYTSSSGEISGSIGANSSIINLYEATNHNNLSDAKGVANSIMQTILREGYSQNTVSELTAMQSNLKTQIADIETVLNQNVTSVKTEISGNFVTGIDGYENLGTLTVADVNAIMKENIVNEQTDEVLGKIIPEYSWNLACVIDTEDISRIRSADRLRIILESMPGTEIEVSIKEVLTEDDKSVIVLAGFYTNEQIIQMRKSNVNIVIRSYSGIEIPKGATRVVDGKLGVFCFNGIKAEFKTISPIFEKEDFYVIGVSNTAKTSDIIIGDRIITNSKAINNNMVIN